MHIAINTIYFTTSGGEDSFLFTEELLANLFQLHPEHQFYLLINKAAAQQLTIQADNLTIIISDKPIIGFQAHFSWNYFQIPALLKKIKATTLIQYNGLAKVSAFINQSIIITNLLWLSKPQQVPFSEKYYHQLFTKQALQKATSVIVLSDALKHQLIEKYPFVNTKVNVLSIAAPPIFKPSTYEQRQQTKDSYADGREYFLFAGGNLPHKNLVDMLRAFSLFKKWQKSNMKLLVMGRSTAQKDNLLDKLSSYKYKDDVALLPDITAQQLAMVTSAAYAFVAPAAYEGTASNIIAAMQCGVPVIASAIDTHKMFAGDACLYAMPGDVDELANQMKLLYRDELLRSSLIEKGLQIAGSANIAQLAAAFYTYLGV